MAWYIHSQTSKTTATPGLCALSADGTKAYVNSSTSSKKGFYSSDIKGTWTESTSAVSTGYWGCAITDDGATIYRSPYNATGYDQKSTDYGATFASTGTSRAHGTNSLIDCDTDGSVVLSMPGGTSTSEYYSQNSGSTWATCSKSSSTNVAVAVSGTNGSIGIATDTGSRGTQRSTNSCATFSTSQSVSALRCCAISADGTKNVWGSTTYIYTSTTSGTLTSKTASTSKTWNWVDINSDGTKLVGGNSIGEVYLSTNSGTNFTEIFKANNGGLTAPVNCVKANSTFTVFLVTTTAGVYVIDETADLTGKALVVAGGGGGGRFGGGGGGGGLIYNSSLGMVTGLSYPVTVGTGGAGDATDAGTGANGLNSVFNGLTAVGGGGGGSRNEAVGPGTGVNGAAGGSGGGASPADYGTPTGGGATAGQGYAGGNFAAGLQYAGSGGGGAGEAGGSNNTPAGYAGKGGDGLAYSITGSSVYYAGGGGGGNLGNPPGPGGNGGGASGSNSAGKAPNGTANTGGGGGGGYFLNEGGDGGKGVIIVSYPSGYTHTGGDETGTDGTDTWVKFTTTGSITLSVASAPTDTSKMFQLF